MPPSGICAIVPRAVARATLRTQRGSPSTRRAASHTITVNAIPISATRRLPNSIAACPPFSG